MAKTGSYVVTAINAANSSVTVTFTLSDGTVMDKRPQTIFTYYLGDKDALNKQLSDYLVGFENGIAIENAATTAKVVAPAVQALVNQSMIVLES